MSKDEDFERIVIPRNTYSKNNSLKFVKLFDKIIESKASTFLPLTELGLKLGSARNKLNDALLWLCDNADQEKENPFTYKQADYTKLRSHIKFTPFKSAGQPGILAEYSAWVRPNVIKNKKEFDPSKAIQITKSDTEAVNNVEGEIQLVGWREKVVAFIEDDKQTFLEVNDPASFNNSVLSELDTEWLAGLFTKAGFEFELEPQLIRVIK